jgi:Zn-dependent M16 (insulinase) family peptidase
MKLELSGQIFAKYSYIKVHENHPVGAELFHVDRHDKANVKQICFTIFYIFA